VKKVGNSRKVAALKMKGNLNEIMLRFLLFFAQMKDIHMMVSIMLKHAEGEASQLENVRKGTTKQEH